MYASTEMRRARGQALMVLLGLLSTLGPFSNDSVLPVFPALQAEFLVSDFELQQTMTVYFLPFAVMMFFHGALSDAFGRRRMVIIGMAAYSLAALVCAAARTYEIFLLGRLLQGISGGAGVVISRAIVRDVYQRVEAQRALALVMIIFGIAPALAPIVGGWLGYLFGWRAVFFFLTVLAAGMLAAALAWLPETLPASHRHAFSARTLASGFRAASTSARFVLLTCAYACNFAGFFIFIVSAPAFGYRILGIEQTEFVWIFGPAIAGQIVGSFVSAQLAGRLRPVGLVFAAYVIMLTAALFNVIYHAAHPATLPLSVLPIFIYTVGMGAAVPSLMLLVLDQMPERRGFASSVIGFAQSGSSALLAGAVSYRVSSSAQSLALCSLVILGIGLVCWCGYLARMAARLRSVP